MVSMNGAAASNATGGLYAEFSVKTTMETGVEVA
jgi:hypothetical protein